MFVAYMIKRHSRTQSDLIDQLFNSSERRLARALNMLTRFGKKRHVQDLAPSRKPRGSGGNDRHDSLKSEFLHESFLEARIHSLQRRPASAQFPSFRCPARVAKITFVNHHPTRPSESYWGMCNIVQIRFLRSGIGLRCNLAQWRTQ
jgi:hypothetical protein